mmetsp:Transcript_153766/g.267984  ORF Transcript_153766/g.267984 Transcript_153766/m.267984 type:complete len:285 (-) Transcript_153766:1520-2374(-)
MSLISGLVRQQGFQSRDAKCLGRLCLRHIGSSKLSVFDVLFAHELLEESEDLIDHRGLNPSQIGNTFVHGNTLREVLSEVSVWKVWNESTIYSLHGAFESLESVICARAPCDCAIIYDLAFVDGCEVITELRHLVWGASTWKFLTDGRPDLDALIADLLAPHGRAVGPCLVEQWIFSINLALRIQTQLRVWAPESVQTAWVKIWVAGMQRNAHVIANRVHFLPWKQTSQTHGSLLNILCWDGGNVIALLQCCKLHPLAPIRDAAIQWHGHNACHRDLACLELIA